MREIDVNAYEFDIQPGFSVSPIFNDVDLTQYYTPVNSPATILHLSFTAVDAQLFQDSLPPPWRHQKEDTRSRVYSM